MGLETVNNIADLVRTNPTGSDPKSQGDDHIRNLKTALLNNVVGYPGAVAVTGVDGGAVNAYTLTPAAGTLVAYGLRMVAVFSPTVTNTGAVTLNIGGLGARNVRSVSGAALAAGDLVAGNLYAAFYNGTEFRMLGITKNYVDQLAFAASLPAQSLGFLTSTGTVASFGTTHTGYAQNEVKGADIASAATINLTTATGNLVHITGTTSITAITIPSGAERLVVFDAVLTLTHNATTLILPTGRNITTAPGDMAIIRGDGAGNARVIFIPFNGQPNIGFQYIKVSDQKSSGTAGGGTTSGSTATRTINTVDTNSMTGASLASDQVTLPAGTYKYNIRAPSLAGQHKAFLFNVSDGVNVGFGSSALGSTGVSTDSFISGSFTITSNKNFRVIHYTANTQATNGFGAPVSIASVNEVYTEAEFWKVG